MALGLAERPRLAWAFLSLTFFIHVASNRTKYTITGYLVYSIGIAGVEEPNYAKTFNSLDRLDSGRSLLDAPFPLRDLGLFAHRERYPRGILYPTGTRVFVGELYCRFATRISLYQRCSARIL